MIKNLPTMKSRQQRRQQELAGFLRMMLLATFTTVICQAQVSVPSDAPPEGICRFAVALPEMDGPVTLGIFSEENQLVRLLASNAPIETLPLGLNGLLISWDGKDDAGLAVPPGTYQALGLVHGVIAVSALPVSETSWFHKVSQESQEIDFLPPALPLLVPQYQMIVLSAKDALLEKQQAIRLSAKADEHDLTITANGLPLVTIPLGTETPITSIELHPSGKKVCAKVTLVRHEGSESYLIEGLDRLVPLNAGLLNMPSDTFHSSQNGLGKH